MTGTTTLPDAPGAATAPTTTLAPEQVVRMDDYVARARAAAEAFRALDQEAVDRIVWAMVVAGLEHAIELAELAMEETGFGVFEDKVVKNYIATEFLYDYLKDKRSVGVIDTDPERGIEYVAEPIGVVLALLPITNPTSTALFKAIVGAKTRNAMLFRPSARAARCALRAIELLQEAGEAAGLPPDALQVIPDPTLDISQYLFHHDGRRLHLDDRRPEGGRGDERRRQAVHGRRLRQRAGLRPPLRRPADGRRRHPHLQDLRRLGHLPGRADVRRRRRDLRRAGRRVRAHGRARADATRRPRAWRQVDDGRRRLDRDSRRSAAPASTSRRSPASRRAPRDKVLLAPLPSDLDELAAHPLWPRS